MGLGTSYLTRRSIGVLSAVIGLAALRTPSGFWIGMVSMLTGFWLISGVALGWQAHGRDRAGWWAFVAAAATSLVVSFGPWSDASLRAGWPDAWSWSSRSERLQPTSRLLAGLIPVVRPETRAVITWREPSGAVTTRLEVTGRFDRLEGLDPVRDQMARIAARMPVRSGDMGSGSQARRAVDAFESSLSMADYQTVGHLLVALLLGGVVRMGVLLAAVRAAAAAPRVVVGGSFSRF